MELLTAIRESGAETVYVTHGFSEEVVRYLNERFAARGLPYRIEHIAVLRGVLGDLRLGDRPRQQGRWSAEEAGLTRGDFNYCTYGGYLNTKAEATGFFRVEKIRDRAAERRTGRAFHLSETGRVELHRDAVVEQPAAHGRGSGPGRR